MKINFDEIINQKGNNPVSLRIFKECRLQEYTFIEYQKFADVLIKEHKAGANLEDAILTAKVSVILMGIENNEPKITNYIKLGAIVASVTLIILSCFI